MCRAQRAEVRLSLAAATDIRCHTVRYGTIRYAGMDAGMDTVCRYGAIPYGAIPYGPYRMGHSRPFQRMGGWEFAQTLHLTYCFAMCGQHSRNKCRGCCAASTHGRTHVPCCTHSPGTCAASTHGSLLLYRLGTLIVLYPVPEPDDDTNRLPSRKRRLPPLNSLAAE